MSKPSKDKAQRRAVRKQKQAAAAVVREATWRARWQAEEDARRFAESPEGKRQAEERRVAQWHADAPRREALRKQRAWEDWLYWESKKPAHCLPPAHLKRYTAHVRHPPKDVLEQQERQKAEQAAEEQHRSNMRLGNRHLITFFGLVAACGGLGGEK